MAAVRKSAPGKVLLAMFALAACLAPPVAAQEPAPTNPPMWRLADGDSEIWLLGTFHILPPALDWRTPAIAHAIEEADTIWFEAETDTSAARQTTLAIVMGEGFNRDGGLLSNLLEPADASLLREIAAEVGLPFAGVDPMRPWQAFLTLSVQAIVARGYHPDAGMDTVLLREARTRGRQLRFFETVEEQLRLFTGLSPQTEKNLLVITLREWDQQNEEVDLLLEAWRTGDVDAIDEMMNSALRERAPEVYETLVTRRNEAWADEIERAMAGSGKILIAVGAGHLVSDDSVPALLRARGFTVERHGAGAAPQSTQTGDEDPIGALLRREAEEER